MVNLSGRDNMFLFVRYTILNLLVFILLPGVVHSASDHKKDLKRPYMNVGVVDIQRVISESKKGKEAKKYFDGLTSLRSTEDMARTEQELIGQIIQDIEIIIEEYAKKSGFTHVVDAFEGGMLYVNEGFNITDKIIELYDKKVERSRSEKK